MGSTRIAQARPYEPHGTKVRAAREPIGSLPGEAPCFCAGLLNGRPSFIYCSCRVREMDRPTGFSKRLEFFLDQLNEMHRSLAMGRGQNSKLRYLFPCGTADVSWS